jgi:hypothetical protein
MMNLLGGVFESKESLQEEVLSILKPMVTSAAAYFALRKAQAPQSQPFRATEVYGAAPVPQDTRKPVLHGHLLATVLRHCVELELHESASILMTNIAKQVAYMDPLDFVITLLRFLEVIVIHLAKTKGNPNVYKSLFQTCLSQYVLRSIDRRPAETNWIRGTVPCTCTNCTRLNAFLRNPLDQTDRFEVLQHERNHMSNQLYQYTECKSSVVSRSTYKETFVVTKKGKSFQDQQAEWQKKQNEVRGWFQAMEACAPSTGSET